MAALLDVTEYFVKPDQRDEILASVFGAVGIWREAADACRIPQTEVELFAPLLNNLPRGLGV